MTEDPPMADPAVKLTKAQREALEWFAGHTAPIIRPEHLSRVTVERLAAAGLLEVKRPTFGRPRYWPSDKGRALLDALKDEGEG